MRKDYTGCHMDAVYMGRGTQNLVTCWIPFMEIPIEKGVLAVCPGSNCIPEYIPFTRFFLFFCQVSLPLIDLVLKV
jgi:ectoine hydroxylase-related dioxygenase (phytanoyl-CoA dioxygenase family)